MVRRALPAILMLALVASSCTGGATPTPTTSPIPTGSAPPSASASPTTSASASTMTLEVWFAYGEHLFVTPRTQDVTSAVGRAAVEALLAGPTEAERTAGVVTAVPATTELLGLTIADGVATVDLTSAFGSGGGSLSMFLRLAQLTYTLTQFRTVRWVNLRIDGAPVEVFGTEGIVLDQPMTRRDYRDQLPPILVRRPWIGMEASSPIRVAGSADVFEAVVSISVLDASGTAIVDATTMATCGTGCRGAFATAVPYEVDETQAGTVRVYEVSAEDGSPVNVVDIPVLLLD